MDPIQKLGKITLVTIGYCEWMLHLFQGIDLQIKTHRQTHGPKGLRNTKGLFQSDSLILIATIIYGEYSTLVRLGCLSLMIRFSGLDEFLKTILFFEDDSVVREWPWVKWCSVSMKGLLLVNNENRVNNVNMRVNNSEFTS